MTGPLVILAACPVFLGLIGTPVWPWFQSFLGGQQAKIDFAAFGENGILPLMLASTVVVFAGFGLGWWFYGRKPIESFEAQDAVERVQPQQS